MGYEYTGELARICNALTRIADALEVLAEDAKERRHTRHFWNHAELQRMREYRDELLEKAKEAEETNDIELVDQCLEGAEDVASAIKRHIEANPHLKGGA